MSFVVRAKRVEIVDNIINCSFALDFIDSQTAISLNGIYKVKDNTVLVGCTEKGRLCVQGYADNLEWLNENYTLAFIDSNNREATELSVTTSQLLDATIGEEISGGDDSDIVGVGRVGYMRLRG